MEYFFKMLPCPLCVYQRFPFLIWIIAAIIGYAGGFVPKKLYIIIAICASLLAGYHTGVEMGIFEMSSFCKPLVLINDNITISDFRQMLYNSTQTPLCNKPAFLFLGLSLASWNLIFNLFVITIITLIKPQN
jgi:disulfide bond formation protein DsbB